MYHLYYCEHKDGTTRYIINRKTKPKIGMTVTAYGSKFRVWYVEYHTDGKQAARCEPVEVQK